MAHPGTAKRAGVHPLNTKAQRPSPTLVLAPMAGITDWPFRLRCVNMGADESVSEMISAQGLLQSPADSAAYAMLLAAHPDERALTAQLFGRDPFLIGEAARRVDQLDQFTGIDLNFGCPAQKVTSSGSGSALMKNLPLAADIIKSARGASKKRLSAKTRLGWDQKSVNAVAFARMCEDSGVDQLCVHGRTRDQQYAGKADWDAIGQVKQAVHIPVIANGDVFSAADALALLKTSGADGVAIGRGALGNPFIFREIRQALNGDEVILPQAEEILDTALLHLRDMAAFKGDSWAAIEMRKHLAWYIKGSRGAAQARVRINRAASVYELAEILRTHLSGASD